MHHEWERSEGEQLRYWAQNDHVHKTEKGYRALFELYPFSAVGIQTGSIEYGHVEIFRLIKIEAINAGVRG